MPAKRVLDSTRIFYILFFSISIYILYSRYFKEGFQSATPYTVDLVIARYKEDLSWLKEYTKLPFRTVYIYNKSDLPVQCDFKDCKIVQLPNVGYCDHTYLYHITKNYSSLADVTIFAPGSSDISYKKKTLQKMIDHAFTNFSTLLGGTQTSSNLKMAEYNFTLDQHILSYDKNRDPGDSMRVSRSEIRPFGRWYEKWFPDVETKIITFKGIHAISRKDIHKRPLRFYKSFIEQVSYAKFHETSHYIERAWAALIHPVSSDSFLDIMTL